MSKLNALGLPVAQLQESPIINDLSVLSTAVPPPDFAGSVKIGPATAVSGNSAINQLVINYPVTNAGAGANAPGNGQYFTIPVRVFTNNLGWQTKHLLVVTDPIA